jgi:hypothetical protein
MQGRFDTFLGPEAQVEMSRVSVDKFVDADIWSQLHERSTEALRALGMDGCWAISVRCKALAPRMLCLECFTIVLRGEACPCPTSARHAAVIARSDLEVKAGIERIITDFVDALVRAAPCLARGTAVAWSVAPDAVLSLAVTWDATRQGVTYTQT